MLHEGQISFNEVLNANLQRLNKVSKKCYKLVLRLIHHVSQNYILKHMEDWLIKKYGVSLF